MKSRAWKAVVVSTYGVMLLALGGCSSCDDEGGNPEVENYFQPLEIGDFELVLEPALQVAERVDFGFLAPGESASRVVEVSNVGRAALHIDRWQMSSDRFEMTFVGFMGEETPRVLEPGETIKVVFSYRAISEEPEQAELLIWSDDPDREYTKVSVTANVLTECITVSERELGFGLVAPEEQVSRAFTVSNCSDVLPVSFEARAILQDQGAFRFENLSPDEVVELEPGEEREVSIRFRPQEPGNYNAVLPLVSEAFETGEVDVDLIGVGAPYACPEAVILASNEASGRESRANPYGEYYGVPLDRLFFDGGESFSSDGSPIVRYRWSLVRRPADSGAVLNQENTSTSGLFLDLTGDYRVELEVWNARGIKSCEPAVMDISATPDEDVHIQLVWDTSNDNNQFDSFGSDVDLHLLKQGGIWNLEPWDCFWQNLEPDWGVRGDRSDNPSLDIDDTDGWGPENINLNNPENGERYHVGVHYFSDQGFGVSYATVRLYLGGRLVREFRRQRLTDQDFWHVAQIRWPEREVIDYNDMYSTFPSGVFEP